MQYLPYLKGLEELERLEVGLADELGVPLPRVEDDPARRVLARVRQAQALVEELGE